MMVVDVECVMVSISMYLVTQSLMTLQHNTILPVIGFSEETRDLQLDEGRSAALTVEVFKPAVGTPVAQVLPVFIGFQIDNTANTGKSLFQKRYMCII